MAIIPRGSLAVSCSSATDSESENLSSSSSNSSLGRLSNVCDKDRQEDQDPSWDPIEDAASKDTGYDGCNEDFSSSDEKWLGGSFDSVSDIRQSLKSTPTPDQELLAEVNRTRYTVEAFKDIPKPDQVPSPGQSRTNASSTTFDPLSLRRRSDSMPGSVSEKASDKTGQNQPPFAPRFLKSLRYKEATEPLADSEDCNLDLTYLEKKRRNREPPYDRRFSESALAVVYWERDWHPPRSCHWRRKSLGDRPEQSFLFCTKEWNATISPLRRTKSESEKLCEVWRPED